MEVPYHSQEELFTCGPACVRMVLAYYGIEEGEEEIASAMRVNRNGCSFRRIKECFSSHGLTPFLHKPRKSSNALARLENYLVNEVPVIVLVNRYVYDSETPRMNRKVGWENDDYSSHFVVVTGIEGGEVSFNDPHEQVGKTSLSLDDFVESWGFQRTFKLTGALA